MPILNVYENIVLPVELDGDTVDQKFMDEVVKMLGLQDKLQNMPNNLSDTGVVLALTIGKETEQKKINNRTGRMRLELAEEMDQEISAGISMLHLRAEEISQAFEEARCALNYKILRGADCCICYEEIKSIEPAADFLDAEDIEAFEKAVDTGEERQYRKVVDIIFDKLESKKESD